MNLTEALKTLIEVKGIDILKSPLSLNILSDYQAFDEIPASKNIIKMMIEQGIMKKIVRLHEDEEALVDTAEGCIKDLHTKYGMRLDTATSCIVSILEALGYDNSAPSDAYTDEYNQKEELSNSLDEMIAGYCEKCGKTIPKDATYCPYCGEPQVEFIDIPPYFISEDTFVLEGRGIVVIGYLPFGKISCGDEVHVVHRNTNRISKGIVTGIEKDRNLYDHALSGSSYGFLIRCNAESISRGDIIYL